MIHRTRRLGVTTAVALTAAALLGMPTSASADTASDGLWWYSALNVQAAHDAGVTGAGAVVAVLDTPINLDVPTLADADIRVQDLPCYAEDGSVLSPTSDDVQTAAHGTSSVSMIVGSGAGYPGQQGVTGVAPDATVLFYAVGDDVDDDAVCFTEDGRDDSTAIARAMEDAIDQGADVISLSILAGIGPENYNAVVRALNAGVVLVLGVSNQETIQDVPGLGLSAYNGIVAVQALDRTGGVATHTDLQGAEQPNVDASTDIAAPGVGMLVQGGPSGWEEQTLRNGTSIATPLVAGFLADMAAVHPDATGNQLIQALISNTGSTDGAPVFDSTGLKGWGTASLTRMLKVDPTTYPDVNPLIVEGGEPSAAEIAAGPVVVEPYTSAPVPSSAVDLGALVLVAGIVGGVVVIGIIVLLVVLIPRSRRRSPTYPGNGGA